jgi:hypothetical protein
MMEAEKRMKLGEKRANERNYLCFYGFNVYFYARGFNFDSIIIT